MDNIHNCTHLVTDKVCAICTLMCTNESGITGCVDCQQALVSLKNKQVL